MQERITELRHIKEAGISGAHQAKAVPGRDRAVRSSDRRRSGIHAVRSMEATLAKTCPP